MPQITQDWSVGPMGPGWFIKFASFVDPTIPPVGGGSGSMSFSGSKHTFLPNKQFPDAVVSARSFDDDEAIAVALLEM